MNNVLNYVGVVDLVFTHTHNVGFDLMLSTMICIFY